MSNETTHVRIPRSALTEAKVLAALDGIPLHDLLAKIVKAELDERGVKLPS